MRGGWVARCLQNYNIRSQEPVTYQNKVDRGGKQGTFREIDLPAPKWVSFASNIKDLLNCYSPNESHEYHPTTSSNLVKFVSFHTIYPRGLSNAEMSNFESYFWRFILVSWLSSHFWHISFISLSRQSHMTYVFMTCEPFQARRRRRARGRPSTSPRSWAAGRGRRRRAMSSPWPPSSRRGPTRWTITTTPRGFLQGCNLIGF